MTVSTVTPGDRSPEELKAMSDALAKSRAQHTAPRTGTHVSADGHRTTYARPMTAEERAAGHEKLEQKRAEVAQQRRNLQPGTHRRTSVHGQSEILAVSQPGPGLVILPGLGTTSIAAAINAGFLPVGWTPAQGLPKSFGEPSGANAGTLKEQPTKQNPDNSKAAQAEDKAADPKDMPPAETLVADASKHLAQLDETLGAAEVDSAMEAIATSGVLDLTELPEGVTQAQVEAIHHGYTVQAAATLKEVGASLAMIEDTLTDEELAQARTATIKNDASGMKNLGKLAVRRLAEMPTADPERFGRMMDAMTAEERDCLKYDAGRKTWMVHTPDGRETDYRTAVMLGIVRV